MDFIMKFLENQIVQAWIAPIIIAIIMGLGGYGINIFRKKRKAEKSIDTYSAAEEKLIDIIRPFFIQELDLDSNVIEAARKGIVQEFRLDDDLFIGMEKIRNILILDILRTRFIKEEDKKRLIDKTYLIFNEEKLELNTNSNYINTKESEIEEYKDSLTNVILSIMVMILSGVIIFTVLKTTNNIFISNTLANSMMGFLAVIITITTSLLIIYEIRIKNNKKKLKFMEELFNEQMEDEKSRQESTRL